MDWFRMYGDMPNDPKIGTLSDAEFRTWVELLCMACKAEQNGGTGLTPDTVNWALRRNVTETLQKLFDTKLVCFSETKEIRICSWEKRQYASDSSTSRVKKFREKQKNQDVSDETFPKRSSNGLEQIQNRTEQNREELQLVPSADADPLLCPTQKLVDAYHELMPLNPRLKVLSDARKKSIRARWLEAAGLDCKPFGYKTQAEGLEAWRSFFAVCADSKFLTGRVPGQQGKPPFMADIDFLISPAGFTKCLENKYHREAA